MKPLNLRPSKKMSSLGENNIVRLAKRLSDELGYFPGDKIDVRGRQGTITLSVELSYVEDIIEDDGCGFISFETYDKILSESPKKITVGCDPEFVLLDKRGKMIHANSILSYHGRLGSDGELGELRPAPAENEYQLVENLRELIVGLKEKCDKYGLDAQAHSYFRRFLLGFHIHIDMPDEVLYFVSEKTEGFLKNMAFVMDYLVGVPSMLIEDNSARRLTKLYGNPSDKRLSARTLEYRTLGGSHLRHPDYAAGIAGLSLCVCKDFLSRAKNDSHGWRNFKEVSKINYVRELYSIPEKQKVIGLFGEKRKNNSIAHLVPIAETLESLSTFKEHSRSIRHFLKLILENKQYPPNIIQNWLQTNYADKEKQVELR